MSELDVPMSWTVRGSLFEEPRRCEDLLQVRSRRGDIFIDVGWYPDGDADGAYFGVLVLNSDWETPVEQVETKSLDDIRCWVQRATAWAKEHSGEYSSWPRPQRQVPVVSSPASPPLCAAPSFAFGETPIADSGLPRVDLRAA